MGVHVGLIPTRSRELSQGDPRAFLEDGAKSATRCMLDPLPMCRLRPLDVSGRVTTVATTVVYRRSNNSINIYFHVQVIVALVFSPLIARKLGGIPLKKVL